MNKFSKQYNDDVSSINSILNALYEVISGEKGEERDWDREKNLFHPKARLIVVRKEEDNHLDTKIMTCDEFIQYAKKKAIIDGVGFYEYEIARRVEEFGHVVHVWSTFGSKYSKEDHEPHTRGINSIQLLNDQKRWWVMNIFWNKETSEFPLPEKYCN